LYCSTYFKKKRRVYSNGSLEKLFFKAPPSAIANGVYGILFGIFWKVNGVGLLDQKFE
jgi:hypothetical protein